VGVYGANTAPRSLETKFPKRRQKVADLACRALEDKSSHVRRNAIKLLTKLINTHPFRALHEGTLKRSDWEQRFQRTEEQLTALLKPVAEMPAKEPGNETVDPEILEDATVMPDASDNEEDMEKDVEKEDNAAAAADRSQLEEVAARQENSEEITRLQLTRKYYVECLKFIDTIHAASEIVMQLLSAKNKSEIIEAMDFFKTLDIHKVETAKGGIRRMLRLIWTKGNSDEGKGVQTHLIDTYKDLFFDAPDGFTENESANYIARNMISLTYETTAAELTSLEQLLSKMMSEGHISDLVVSKLWGIYGVQKKEISRKQRRGAIIVLGMLALADPEIVIKELETIVRVGLGPLGRSDLGLAKYTCLALRHISPTGRKAKGIAHRFPFPVHCIDEYRHAITNGKTTKRPRNYGQSGGLVWSEVGQ
jgi:condensin complex subunit 1